MFFMVRMEREQSRMTPWMFEQLRAELLAEIEMEKKEQGRVGSVEGRVIMSSNCMCGV